MIYAYICIYCIYVCIEYNTYIYIYVAVFSITTFHPDTFLLATGQRGCAS